MYEIGTVPGSTYKSPMHTFDGLLVETRKAFARMDTANAILSEAEDVVTKRAEEYDQAEIEYRGLQDRLTLALQSLIEADS